MNKSVFILGGSQTDFQRNWTKEGKNFIAMFNEIVNDGLQSVQIEYDEIRELGAKKSIGIFVGNFNAQQYIQQGHLGSFLTMVDKSFNGIPAARYEAACASGSVAIDAASAKIRAGDIEVAIVIGFEIMKSVSSKEGADYLGTAAYYEREAKGVSFPFPKLFDRLADEMLSKYNIREKRLLDSLAEISKLNYENAKRNPNAQTRSWFMNKNHALLRNDSYNFSIGGKLCIADCSQITDGAALLVLCSADFAKKYIKKRNMPVRKISYIKGMGFTVAPTTFSDKIIQAQGQKHILPWTKQAVDDAYRVSGLSIKDIDVIETHDCFTSSEYACISAFGLSQPGKEYEVVESGTIHFAGKKPINPSGGLIGAGHPVGATGVRMMLDLHKQVTQTAGEYQVAEVRNGLMLNIGGSATTNIAYIIGK